MKLLRAFDQTALVHQPHFRCGPIIICLFILTGVSGLSGCSTVGHVVDPLNFRGLGKNPVRIGITELKWTTPPLMLPRHSLLNDNLAFYLNEPVIFDLLLPRQIRVHLYSGRINYALLAPGDYCRVSLCEDARLLAMARNTEGQILRRGLIIVSADSDIKTLEDLKMRRFHLLPRDDPLNLAARDLLLEADIAEDDLDQGLLGLGIGTRHISSFEVAKSVNFEKDTAGVIDAREYEKWPKTDGNFLLLNPSQDMYRVLGETVSVPVGFVVASVHNSPELDKKVKNYLLNVVEKRQLVIKPMGYSGFTAPIAPEQYEPFMRLYRRTYPPETEPADDDAAEEVPTTLTGP